MDNLIVPKKSNSIVEELSDVSLDNLEKGDVYAMDYKKLWIVLDKEVNNIERKTIDKTWIVDLMHRLEVDEARAVISRREVLDTEEVK